MEYPNRKNMDIRRMQMFPAPGSMQQMSFQPSSTGQPACSGQQGMESWSVQQSEAGGCGCMGNKSMENESMWNEGTRNVQNTQNTLNMPNMSNTFVQKPFRPLEQSENFTVGMGYIPMQRWEQTYDMENGMRRGTVFPSLDLPFMMGRCR